MSLHRFFLESAAEGGGAAREGSRLALSDRDVHHARDVLRLGPGEEIVVVAPDGIARVVRVTAIGAAIEAETVRELPRSTEPRVWLVAGLAKGERTDLAVRMAVEIGVEGVVPVATARTVVRLDEERLRARGDRLRRVALEAAKQSQRAHVPVVTDPIALSDLASALPAGCRVLVAWEGPREPPTGAGAARGVASALASADADARTPVAVVVGPEGGLERAEVALLEADGAHVFGLGDTVLRSETAAVVACALALFELGGLGGARA